MQPVSPRARAQAGPPGPRELLGCRQPPPSSVHSLRSSGLRNRLCETVLPSFITITCQSRSPTTWVAALCNVICLDQQGGRPWPHPVLGPAIGIGAAGTVLTTTCFQRWASTCGPCPPKRGTSGNLWPALVCLSEAPTRRQAGWQPAIPWPCWLLSHGPAG